MDSGRGWWRGSWERCWKGTNWWLKEKQSLVEELRTKFLRPTLLIFIVLVKLLED